jgi:hypothetical protein
VATPEDLEIRVRRLESIASKLITVATRAYIAFLSIPLSIRDQDPDFSKSMDQMSETLEQVAKLFEFLPKSS